MRIIQLSFCSIVAESIAGIVRVPAFKGNHLETCESRLVHTSGGTMNFSRPDDLATLDQWEKSTVEIHDNSTQEWVLRELAAHQRKIQALEHAVGDLTNIVTDLRRELERLDNSTPKLTATENAEHNPAT